MILVLVSIGDTFLVGFFEFLLSGWTWFNIMLEKKFNVSFGGTLKTKIPFLLETAHQTLSGFVVFLVFHHNVSQNNFLTRQVELLNISKEALQLLRRNGLRLGSVASQTLGGRLGLDLEDMDFGILECCVLVKKLPTALLELLVRSECLI